MNALVETRAGAPVGGGAARWASAVGFEARVMARRPVTVLSVLFGPAVMIMFAVAQRPATPAAWAVLAGVASLLGMLISGYGTVASVLTVRRESGVLNRQRTTELTAAGIVTSTAAPLFLVGVVQTLVIFGVYVGLGAPMPQRPELVLLATLLGGVFCAAAGALTCTISRSAESVQFTSAPLLIGSAVAANLLASPFVPDAVRSIVLLVPGTSMSDLVTRAWLGESPGLITLPVGVPVVLVDLILLVLWTVLCVLLSRVRWRWTSRS